MAHRIHGAVQSRTSASAARARAPKRAAHISRCVPPRLLRLRLVAVALNVPHVHVLAAAANASHLKPHFSLKRRVLYRRVLHLNVRVPRLPRVGNTKSSLTQFRYETLREL